MAWEMSAEQVRASLFRGTRTAGRYMGQQRAAQFGRCNRVPGELLVRVTPSRVIAQAERAD